MKVGLDTSVVVRLLVGEPLELARIAMEYLIELQQDGGFAVVSDLVISEAYFALQYHYKVPKADAIDKLHRFLTSKGIETSGVAIRVLATPHLESAKPGFVDRMIHQHYMDGADEMVTFESSANRLSKVRILKV